MNAALKNELIEKYRKSLSARYDWDSIKNDPKLPGAFERKTIDELRNFFLDNLYSEPVSRAKLDDAFKQLESFVAHPTKIWGILGSLPRAILQYGFHFPTAIRAGLAALHTHTTARQFEDSLLRAAIDQNYKVPLSDKQFSACLTAIPISQIEKLINDLSTLFKVVTDKELLGKTINIMQDVLKRMEDKKDLYSSEDAEAIELGISIFKKGYSLLAKYDEKTKGEIADYVVHNEWEFINNLHKKVPK